MPFAVVDGIRTRYEVVGSGPPLLLFSPGGFDATLEKWTTLSVYARIKPIEHLSKHYTCVIFDRRECGESGGRFERITWASYVTQGKALLEHLDIERTFLMGGCMGCCPVMAFAIAHPEATLGMILYWPVGGAKYRISGRQRFAEHLAFVEQQGLAAVVKLVGREGKAFNAEPKGGPWASVIRTDAVFAEAFARQDIDDYKRIVVEMSRTIYDRDTAPGAEPEDLMRLEIPALIIPGRDPSHATSAARYLEECLPNSQYWDVPPEGQTEETVTAKLLEFLDAERARGR